MKKIHHVGRATMFFLSMLKFWTGHACSLTQAVTKARTPNISDPVHCHWLDIHGVHPRSFFELQRARKPTAKVDQVPSN